MENYVDNGPFLILTIAIAAKFVGERQQTPSYL